MPKCAQLKAASLHKEMCPVRRISILQQCKYMHKGAHTLPVLSFFGTTKQESTDTVIYSNKLFCTAEMSFRSSTVARHDVEIISSHMRECN